MAVNEDDEVLAERRRLMEALDRFLSRDALDTPAAIALDVAWTIGTIVLLLGTPHAEDTHALRSMLAARWSGMAPEVKQHVRRIVLPFPHPRPAKAIGRRKRTRTA